MPDHLLTRLATPADQPNLLRLLEDARHTFAAFGPEDVPRLLADDLCLIALDDHGVSAFLTARPGQGDWAFLRGLAIRDHWRLDDGLDALLQPALAHLRAAHIAHLAVYATALWLPPLLQRAGFEQHEWLITLERHARAQPDPVLPTDEAHLRAVQPADLPALLALDAAAFAPLYQLSRQELVSYMITSGYFVVIASLVADEPQLLGYACADVFDETGQIIRLAVHPAAQGRGIGRALLNAAVGYCAAAGARRCIINTQRSNTASLHLYETYGFRRVGPRVPLLARAL
ncbi:MAG: GNAT family N-acetyltransferase [Anaerolineae bacterium]